MPPQEKLSNDDPQIHLLAAKYCEKSRTINLESINDEQVKVLISCIQFFAHYIKYLPECVNDVLRICKIFLTITKDELIEFDVAAFNRIVGICTVMLIRRREEDVIRSTCVVLKEVLDIIPSSTLKIIVTKYAKTLTFIFQKIYVVQTYYTQLRILEIFVYITKNLTKLLNETISKHHLMRNAKEETKQIVIEKISKIDLKDFEVSSRKFLRFFNNNLFPKTCILSVEGRMTKMNGHIIKQKENMLVNFNGRNLTVSFFIPNSVFSSQQNSEKDISVFIEFECKSISSLNKIYKGKPFVDVLINVSHAITYNEDMTRESLDEIKTISLRLIDDNITLKKFSELYYEKFKQNERMINDQVSCIDKMSIMTFQTSASLLDNLKTMNEAKLQPNQEIKTQDPSKENELPKIEKTQSVQVKPKLENETAFENLLVKKETTLPKKATLTQTKLSQTKTRPKRQSAKKASELLSDIYDEDNMDDEGKLPTSYRDFKAQQKKKEEAKTIDKFNNSQDSNRNYYLEPVEIITRTTLKSETTKFKKLESKPKHYDTDEENHKVKRNVRSGKKQEHNIQQPKTRQRKAKELKERIPLTNIETVNNVINDKVDVKFMNNKDLSLIQQNQKRKLPENCISAKPIMNYDNIEMIEQSVKIVNQTNKNHNINDDSITSGRSIIPVLYKEKPAIKRPIPVDNQDEIPGEKRRRLTIDNVFDSVHLEKELPKAIGVTSKVENWLKSTSDSFSLDMSLDHIDPEIPAKQKASQIKDVLPKDAPNKDDDNESELSCGQFANDEHQHYSSSSHESMDLDSKNFPKPHKKVALVAEKKPKLEQKNQSSHHQVNNAPKNVMLQNNRFKNPAKNFKIRISEAKVELVSRKKKIDENDKNARMVYDQRIAKIGQKCLEHSLKTKAQLKQVHQLFLRYESAKSKLNDEITEQDKWIVTLNREIEKRDEALKGHYQNRKKELIKLKNDALNKNEELMQDIWCDYIDNFQSRFNNTIQKAYDL